MKKDNWPVNNHGIRPAGKPDECFYCQAKKGSQHNQDCVVRERTIVMEMKVEVVMSVPEHWDQDMCNFHKNESSWCADNILPTLERLSEQSCLCDFAEFTYVREATKEDEEAQGVFVEQLPS